MKHEDNFYGSDDRYRDAIAGAFGYKYRDERSDRPVCPDGSEQGLQEIWKWVLGGSTERLRPLAAKANERNLLFTPENDQLQVDDPDVIEDICLGIRDPKEYKYYHGCTEQEDWRGRLNRPYVKPESNTYLSNAWSENSFKRGARHEASHLEIRTMMQLMRKLNNLHRLNKLKYLESSDFNLFMDAMMSVDALLDYHDVPRHNPLTGKVELDKNYDVIPHLDRILDLFYNALGLTHGN